MPKIELRMSDADKARMQDAALLTSLTGFTPGPWVKTRRYIGTPKHKSFIAECRDINGNWSDTAMSVSNAALIAAAPDLHRIATEQAVEIERLREALETLSNIHDGNPSDAMADTPPLDYARHMLWEARCIARKALAVQP